MTSSSCSISRRSSRPRCGTGKTPHPSAVPLERQRSTRIYAMRMTIKLKLAIAFIVIVGLAGAMAALGISSLGSINTSMDEMLKGPVQRVQMAGELQTNLLLIVRAEKNMILADTPEAIRRYDDEITKERAEFLSRIEKFQAVASAEGKQKLATINAPWQQWVAAGEKMREM